MEDWTKKTDHEIFTGVGEQIGSQAAYCRETEIKRRLYILQQKALLAQWEANEYQKKAINEQRDATEEMRQQSRLIRWTVIGIFLTALVTFVTAFIA